MALYAAYGSNLDPRQMAERAPHSPPARHRLAGRLAADVRRRGPRLGRRARDRRRGPGDAGLRHALRRHAARTSARSTAGRAPRPASTARSGCGCTRSTASTPPGSTCSTPTRAACRRPATSADRRRSRGGRRARRLRRAPAAAALPLDRADGSLRLVNATASSPIWTTRTVAARLAAAAPRRAHRRRRGTTSRWCSAPAGCRPPTRSATPATSCPSTDLPGFAAARRRGARRPDPLGRRRRTSGCWCSSAAPTSTRAAASRAVVHGVRTAAAAGCRTVVLTNGCGGLRPGLDAGHPGADQRPPQPDRALAAVGARRSSTSPTSTRPGCARCAARSSPTCREGVYAQFPGPHYETPAEIRMVRALGGDLVGMSTALEAIAAREAGMEVLGISLVTNLAAGHHRRAAGPRGGARGRPGRRHPDGRACSPTSWASCERGRSERAARPGHRRGRVVGSRARRRPARGRLDGRRAGPGRPAPDGRRASRSSSATRRRRGPGRGAARLRRGRAPGRPSRRGDRRGASPRRTSSAPRGCSRPRRAGTASTGSSSPAATTPSASPRARTLVGVDVRPRPDTFYGVGKVAGGGARLATTPTATACDVACLRIGTFRDRPGPPAPVDLAVARRLRRLVDACCAPRT